jgi:hypothetical protein
MRRFIALLIATAGIVTAAAPPTGGVGGKRVAEPALIQQVRALVRRLGADAFDDREAAHNALLRLGADIVPVLDMLGPQKDPEVRDRLRRICRVLVPYREEVLGLLGAMNEKGISRSSPLFAAMDRVLAKHQPRSGDFLLSLILASETKLRHRAVFAFAASWNTMTPNQVDAYLRQALLIEAHSRKHYPLGEDVSFGMMYLARDGWEGWPEEKELAFVTRTTHYLDGKPFGEPFDCRGPGATTGWVGTKGLALGEHACSAKLEYTYKHRGKSRSGVLRSRAFSFSIIAPADFEDLAAPKDAALDRKVRGTLRFAQKLSDFEVKPLIIIGEQGKGRGDGKPQITWGGPRMDDYSITTPWWEIDKPLPVDLCFDVALREKTSGKLYPCSVIVLLRGKTRTGYFAPKDVEGFARDNPGEVSFEAVLTPSRKMAITMPQVTRYYAGSITSGVLKVKCIGPGK